MSWQETEGLKRALEENLNSIEMILAEIDGQTRESAAQLSRAEAALEQREERVARLRAQVTGRLQPLLHMCMRMHMSVQHVPVQHMPAPQ